MYTLETAKEQQAKACYQIIDDGRRFQQEQGFTQWTEDYPNLDTIRLDIANQKGFVIKNDDEIAAYMCIDFDGEPAYNSIEGGWNSQDEYAVVHRMAFSKQYQGKGLVGIAWKLIEDFCDKNDIHYIRIDTDPQNKRMQHVLEKNGFKPCGVIVFQGSGKLAYDKLLK